MRQRTETDTKTTRSNQAFKSGTALLGLALFALFCVYFVREATKISVWKESGQISMTRMRAADDSVVVFRRVILDDFVGSPYPAVGDTVLTLRDSAATQEVVRNLTGQPQEVGLEIPVTYRHEGEEYETRLITRVPGTSGYWLIVLLQWLRFLIGFGFIGVGLWAFFARPDSSAVRVFAIFCSAMTAFMISGVSVISDSYAAFDIPLWDWINNFLQALTVSMSALWLNLQMLFPRPGKLMKRHPVIAYALCWVVPVLTIPGMIFDASLLTYALIINSSMGAQFVGGFIILGIRHSKTQDRVEKRQTRLVLWGSGLGLSALITLVVVAQVFSEWFTAEPMRPLILINVAFVLLLLMPISYVYAFGRYRLLEVQGKVKRGTRLVLLVLLLGAAYGAAAVFLGDFLITQLGITSRAPMLGIAVVIALGITPVSRKLRAILERKFYPERERLRTSLEHFLEGPDYLGDRESFWGQLEERIREGLLVESVIPIVAGENGFEIAIRGQAGIPFARESSLVQRLEKEKRPVLLDELVASGRVQLNEDEDHWLNTNRIALIMPLVARQRLVGFLGIGFKTENEDYAPEELRILSSLSPQMALACENVRLLEENVEKQRLQEQMDIARRIQEGFLPRTLPATPGLEVAAASRFSLEVAGDYHDVIALDSGETVVAVGDVSGKGAGAALLMANLQASLRTAMGMGIPLKDTVARINDLICQNTPPEQYITFIVAVYDSAALTLTYVNAGHNPPILIRANGEHELLDAGGLILGFLTGSAYETGEVQLNTGDLVFMFTDGISEAMNADDEEYGEDRILEFVKRHRASELGEILTGLEANVEQFCGRVPDEDDRTLLIARASQVF